MARWSRSSSLLLVGFVPFLGACATGSGGGVAAFEPLREAHLEGGECLQLPTAGEGVRLLTAYFPSRLELDTVVNLTLDGDGYLLRYSETRGAPRPAASLEEIRARSAETPRTQVQLDFETGEALALNLSPGESVGRGVSGSVEEFRSSALLADFEERVERVRALCEP